MDWKAIRTEYITGNISHRKLAEKYSAPYTTLKRKASREQWCELRSQYRLKEDSKTLDKASNKRSDARANTIELFDTACDLLLNRAITLASNELTSQEMRQLSATLKDLKELKNIRSDADIREQEARIKKLEAEINGENRDATIVVHIDDGAGDWSK